MTNELNAHSNSRCQVQVGLSVSTLKIEKLHFGSQGEYKLHRAQLSMTGAGILNTPTMQQEERHNYN